MSDTWVDWEEGTSEPQCTITSMYSLHYEGMSIDRTFQRRVTFTRSHLIRDMFHWSLVNSLSIRSDTKPTETRKWRLLWSSFWGIIAAQHPQESLIQSAGKGALTDSWASDSGGMMPGPSWLWNSWGVMCLPKSTCVLWDLEEAYDRGFPRGHGHTGTQVGSVHSFLQDKTVWRWILINSH